MKAATDLWSETLERWQGMIPPLAQAAVMDPWQAGRAMLDIQRSALDTWRDSCVQAHELGVKAVEWNATQAERMARSFGDQAR